MIKRALTFSQQRNAEVKGQNREREVSKGSMSKHIWPLSPPQKARINECVHELTDREIKNDDILQTISLPQVNVLILMTPARVLVYNMKPLALVASHERSSESISEFGLNRSITPSTALDRDVNGLLSQQESYSLIWNQGKVVFYVVTERNFILSYQILKSSTNLTTFKEYGIPVIDVGKIREDIDHDFDDTLDNDTLTVFERNKASRIIQNGYTVTKDKGFLQFLSVNQDNINELPVKKLELRLKVVLKFDYQIIDLFGFKRLLEGNKSKAEESLLVLFPHGLQLLSLEEFKLKKTSLVELTNGKEICFNAGHLIVISKESEEDISINVIDFSNKKVKSNRLEVRGTLLSCFELRKRLALIFEDRIIYFNTTTNQVDYSYDPPFRIKLGGKLSDEMLLMISTANSVHFVTPLGNSLFSSSADSDLEKPPTTLEYSDFAYVDKFLVLVSHSGNYEVWNLWEEAKQTFSDSRSPVSYVLHNNNNDVAIYSPLGSSPVRNDSMQMVKLPTKTINNCVSQIKVNSNLKMMAVYVSNKNILLIHNLETNAWYDFNDLTIIDMHWLCSSYLLCQIKTEDWATSVQCFRFHLQGLDTSDISKYRVWEYEIPTSVPVLKVKVNVSSKYRLLKLKSRESPELEKYGEKFYRTAEIIIVTENHISIFAVLSIIHPSGVNIIKKFHEQAKIELPAAFSADSIEWITSFKDGLIYLYDDKIIKTATTDAQNWREDILLRDVERIIDVVFDEIYFVCKTQELFYKMDDLWEGKPPMLSIPLEDDFYPISVTSETTTTHGLNCLYHEDYVKLVLKHKIYLDQIIAAKMDQNVDPKDIMAEFGSIRHYKFALEKILSLKILASEPLNQIVELVKLCDAPLGSDMTTHNNQNGSLEIISNCLRKIEIKHWNQLFTSLKMTPRDLLARCLEGNEAKILGVLLLVFLNYDAELVEDLRNDEIPEEEEGQNNSEFPDSSVVDLIRDQEMMLRVLRLLVTSGANATDSTKAADSWDMCFQLMRLLKELDKENNTHLVQQALDMLQ